MTKDKTKHNCSNCSAFGKHCPHKVNGDPYHYDCGMTVEDIEKENAEAKERIKTLEYRCENIKDTDTMELVALQRENAELKILVSSMLYEINALWDISEMNEDVRKHAEKIDSEVEK